MQRLILSLAASLCLIALLGTAKPAHAARATFVSGNGDDNANCLTPDTACREITAALPKTDPFGTVHVLSGEYGAFPINQSVDILAESGAASVLHGFVDVPGGGFGAVVITGDPIVRLRGLVLNNSSAGIVVVGAAILHLENSVLVNANTDFSIDFRPTSSSELYVSGTILSGAGNGGGGVRIKPTGSGSAKVVLDNVNVEDNPTGILIDGRSTTGSNTVTIRNSTISGSTTFGVYAADSGGGATNVTVEGSTSANNTTFGVGASGTNATVRVRNSTVNGNGTGLQIASSGKIISHSGNVVAGNTTNGAFTSTVAQQ